MTEDDASLVVGVDTPTPVLTLADMKTYMAEQFAVIQLALSKLQGASVADNLADMPVVEEESLGAVPVVDFEHMTSEEEGPKSV